MTTALVSMHPADAVEAADGKLRSPDPLGRLKAWQRLLIYVGCAFILLSLVRWFTGAEELTSAGTVTAALLLAVPIALAGLGGLWSERAGVVNIGLEGMMIMGTWFGAWGGIHFGPWTGVLMGAAGGAVFGLLHGLATITFGVDQIVSGVAINILGSGLARYLTTIAYAATKQTTQSPQVPGKVGSVTLPFLAGGFGTPDLLSAVARTNIPIVADLAGVLRGLSGNVSLLVLLTLALFACSWYVLWRTPLGLRLRYVGEDPLAAESLGVNVYRMKYIAVAVSGAMAGVGGAALVLAFARQWQDGQTNGRGYIGLAAMIFGNWKPGGLSVGSLLFGFTDALQLRSENAIRALLLFIGLLLLALGVRAVLMRRRWSSVVNLVGAVVLVIVYFALPTVPRQFVAFAPHLLTLLVLIGSAQRLRPPAADGVPYRRGGH